MPATLLLAQVTLAAASAAQAGEAAVSIAAVGHIVMGTSYPKEKPALPKDGGKALFEATKPFLKDADVAFGNLAAPLSDRGATRKKVDGVNVFAFRTPASYGQWLKDAGFDVLNAANNHILDFGLEAYQDTLKNLDALGIAHTGRKGEAFFTTAHGIRVAVVGFTQPYNDFFESHHDIEKAAQVVRDAKAKADVVIVGFHGGTEGKGSEHVPRAREYLGSEDRGEVVRFAHAAVDAGADLVVGFGPHLPRAMEFYKHKLIDYALGNFLTYGPFNLSGACGLSLILQAKFDKQGNLLEAKAVPVKVVKPGVPEPDPSGSALTYLGKVSLEDFPESAPQILADGRVRERDGPDRQAGARAAP